MKELCEVCQRVIWGEVVRLGFDKWRHEACYPGSAIWLEAFRLLPAERRTEEGRMIYEAKVRESVQAIGVSQPTQPTEEVADEVLAQKETSEAR
jgi:hypothetical protein